MRREHINVVFIGHVDAGKSTIGGQILFLTGGVDERTIQKYERCGILLGSQHSHWPFGDKWRMHALCRLKACDLQTVQHAVCAPAVTWARIGQEAPGDTAVL